MYDKCLPVMRAGETKIPKTLPNAALNKAEKKVKIS